MKEVHPKDPGVPILRKNDWGQSFSLSEAPPSKNPMEVVEWLDVQNHLRWEPRDGKTFCNVYAHDYCRIMGAYLPRVWSPDGRPGWELSANALYYWLIEYSSHFGWVKLENEDEAQEAANKGAVVVICARNVDPNASGHISVVLPEVDASAKRVNGKVMLPLQSQAGSTNIKKGYLPTPWWWGTSMAEHGFWAWWGNVETKERVPYVPEAAPHPLGRADRAEREEDD